MNKQWNMGWSMAMQQEPIDWRYLPYIRLIFQAYVREYPHKIWSYMVQYLQFRFLKISHWSDWISWVRYDSMLVGGCWWFGTMFFFDFPFRWECHHPNWGTHIVQRGWNQQPVKSGIEVTIGNQIIANFIMCFVSFL